MTDDVAAPSPPVPPAGSALLGSYAVLVGAEVVGLAFSRPVATIASILLMPVLAVFVAVGTGLRTPLARWTVIALVLAWAGDNTDNLLLKIGLFLPANLAYITGFWRYRREAPLLRPGLRVVLAVILAGITILAASHAGILRGPVIVYGISLAVMMLLASGVDTVAAIGAVAFFAADCVLALEYFVLPGLPSSAAIVNQLLYLPGQALIAVGVVLRVQREVGR